MSTESQIQKINGIWAGFTLDDTMKGGVEWALHRNLPPGTYEMSLTGHRILVAKDRAEEMYKGVIAKPLRARQDEENEMGSGYVISVGPCVGDGNSPHPTGLICDHPTAILGRHVYFQMWSGKTFRTDDNDDEFETKDSLIILTDRDIQSFDV